MQKVKDERERGIAKFEQFLERISPPKSSDIEDPPRRFIWRVGFGPVSLSDKQADDYEKIVTMFCPDSGSPGEWSRAAIDSMLSECMIAVAESKEPNPSAQRKKAIAVLRTKLNRQAEDWSVWRQVDNILVPESGCTFGRIFLCRESHAEAATPRSKFVLGDDQINGRKTAFCKTIVRAVDSSAAVVRAENELQYTLDILNFFSSCSPEYNPTPVVSLHGSWVPYIDTAFAERVSRQSTNSSIKPRRTTNFLVIEALGWPKSSSKQSCTLSASLAAPRQARDEGDREVSLEKAFERTNILLAEKDRTLGSERLLSAMQWAGKATVADSCAISYLFNFIALEALLCGTTRQRDFDKLLRKRIKCCIPERLFSEVQGRIKSLHQLRCALVHSGSTEVPLCDSECLRRIVGECIVRLVCNQAIDTMATDALEAWFSSKEDENTAVGPV